MSHSAWPILVREGTWLIKAAACARRAPRDDSKAALGDLLVTPTCGPDRQTRYSLARQPWAASEAAIVGGATWTNWVGNQSFPAAAAMPARRGRRRRRASASAIARGRGRARRPPPDTRSRRSASPTARARARGSHRRAHVDAGSAGVHGARRHHVGEFGEPLWAAGLALANQGDIDTQADRRRDRHRHSRLGHRLGSSFSATLRRAPASSTATARSIEIVESTPELLHAAQVAVGMLGVMTEVEVEVVAGLPARRAHPALAATPRSLERWDELVARATATSRSSGSRARLGALYGLETPAGVPDGGHLLREDLRRGRRRRARRRDPESPASTAAIASTRRCSSRTSTSSSTSCRSSAGREAVAAMRELMLASQPDARLPDGGAHGRGRRRLPLLPVRHADDGHLVSRAVPGTDYWAYLRDVDRLLGEFGARVHWGKLHFLTREQLLDALPGGGDVHRIRRELDPAGVFLNDHLRPLFA